MICHVQSDMLFLRLVYQMKHTSKIDYNNEKALRAKPTEKEMRQKRLVEQYDKVMHEPEMSFYEKKKIEKYWDDEDTYEKQKRPRLGGLKTVHGDVLDSNEAYILQPCDCISLHPTKNDEYFQCAFPFANPYGTRQVMKGFRDITAPMFRPKPGSIQVFTNPMDEDNNIVAMYCQVGSGKPFTGVNKKMRFGKDTWDDRLQYFKMCMDQISELHPPNIALEEGFGCYGNEEQWHKYCDVLDSFIDANPHCYTVVYKRT